MANVQYGFCKNNARCQLAKHRERVFIPSDGRCPQCGQPLVPESMSRKRIRILPILLILAAMAAGGYYGKIWWESPRNKQDITRNTPASGLTPAADENPDAPKVVDNPDTDPNQTQNKAVKAEVLKRIDLYPKLSEVAPDQKEKLYDLISRAKAIGCVMIIPFAEKQEQLTNKERDLLLKAAKSDAIQKLTQDPTMLIFVLGYADKQGDSSQKDKSSLARANNVLGVLRDQGGIPNLMYAVGMGGTDLFSDQTVVRNRRVEVWVVFP